MKSQSTIRRHAFLFLLFAAIQVFGQTSSATSSEAFAKELVGQWRGWGTWTYEGQGADCPMMTIGFRATPEKLNRLGGYFDCQVVGLETAPAEWRRDGERLFDGERQIGKYTGTDFESVEILESGVKVTTRIHVEGDHLDYFEDWFEKSGRPLYEIRGRMFRRQTSSP